MIDLSPDVLLIEDNQLDVELCLQALKHRAPRTRILVISDGVQALDFIHRTGAFAKRPQGEPKLIVLDLKLPLVDGRSLLQQISSDPVAKIIPMVIMSSSCEPNEIISAYKLGINSYIVKPVNSDEYLETIKCIAQYWLFINQQSVA